ncbi:MAG TPA: CidA/LrgA family protein [Thioalkalivibrio sp.]|nr:CidA/LrgA family protein [Thioalkalivibrio sp.]
MVHAILALLVCQLLGEVIVRAAGIPIPGPVVGTLLMLAALAVLREVPGELNSVAGVLLSHLSLLFVPAGVGVMLHVARIKAEWLPLLAGLLVSTALTIAVTALVFFWVMRKMGLQEAEQNP